ncbi:hypothetical protein BDV93DRAFT_529210 [Ceratobasidium sp. AG-I]|nr:hypothetical protein BDV93DRAFT_529210 [Ceratobasidium sp. AG-I]
MNSHAGYIPLPAYSSTPPSPINPASPLPDYDDQRSGRLGNSYQSARMALDQDPRFQTEEPSRWARVVLLFAVAALFWLAFHMKSASFIGMEDS